MGMFFSSLHIHTAPGLTADAVADAISVAWGKQGYRRTEDPKDAALTLDLLSPEDGSWFSLQSEDLELNDPQSVKALAGPLSAELHTAVLAVSCFDSDYLFLNWIDDAKKLDAWANVGHCPGVVPRMTRFAPWEQCVDDPKAFRRIIKADRIFAEDVLAELAPLLDLPAAKALPVEEIRSGSRKLLFSLEAMPEAGEAPRLALPVFDLMPCTPGKDKIITAINRGGASRGLGIAFAGPWVERDEIRITALRLESCLDRYPRSILPLTAEKRQDANGNWILYAEVPDFPIPQAVSPGLSPMKKLREEFARTFGVRFTPEGDPRKFLDITVVFIPLENVQGQCGWCVWAKQASKEAFIRQYNETWSRNPKARVPALDPDDFDL